jgi:plasmid stability protein
MQYTIRNVPKAIDQALRQKAKAQGKSLNQAVVDVLKQALLKDGPPIKHHDLDFMIGTWVEDPEFDKAIAAQDQIEPEMWK